MKNELIITSELINSIITKTIENFKQTVQENLSDMKSLEEEISCCYIINKVLNSAVYAQQSAEKITECIQYLITILGYTDDIDVLVCKKCTIIEKENRASIEEQREDLIDICKVNVNDILLGSEIEKLLNLLINDERNILNNLSMIQEYTNRLKAIQR